MQKRILAFGASSSRQSINSKFAGFAASQQTNVKAILIQLHEFDLPIYSVDHEKNFGIPDDAHKFYLQIQKADGIIISLAEHNGLYTSAFKNLWDWISRIDGMNIWKSKPMFLLSASPSKKERNYVMKVSMDLFPALVIYPSPYFLNLH